MRAGGRTRPGTRPPATAVHRRRAAVDLARERIALTADATEREQGLTRLRFYDRKGVPMPIERDQPSEVLISQLAEDVDLADLVELFVNELPGHVKTFQQALAQADLAKVAWLAHQLKGSAGGHGFPSMTEPAAELERLAKANADPAQLQDSIGRFAELCRRAEAGLAAARSAPTEP